jgi:hypothetical protein
MTVRRRHFWPYFILACVIAQAFGTFAVWKLGDWPFYAAAFCAPLWATIGAIYAEHAAASNQDTNPK